MITLHKVYVEYSGEVKAVSAEAKETARQYKLNERLPGL